jgi:acyl dehydratase
MEDPKSHIGKETPEFTFEVEKGNIRDFAIAIGDLDPMFHDEEYARKTRFGGIIATNTFSHAFRGEKTTLLKAIPQIGARIPQKLLHGEHEIEYFQPVRPGDVIKFKIRIADIHEAEGKRSGKMDVVILDVPCFNQKGEKVIGYKQTFVIRR